MRLFETKVFETPDDVKDFINENCKPYLRENPNHLENKIYRGLATSSTLPRIMPIEQNRKPVDTPRLIDDAINNGLKEAGFTAIRSNSIFCTGNRNQAQSYGSIFVIYPIGDFSFTWSPEIRDMFSSYGMFFANGVLRIPEDTWVETPRIHSPLVDKIYKKVGNDYSALLKNLKPGTYAEVIQQYSDILNQDTKTIIHELFQGNADPVFTKLARNARHIEDHGLSALLKKHYSNEHLVEAINAKKELMITCEKYLAIPVRFFEREIANAPV